MQFISEYLWPKYASEHWLTQINAGYDGCVVCQKHFPVRDISHESIFAITPASDSPDSWTSLGWQNWGEQKQGTSPGGMETWVTLEQEVLRGSVTIHTWRRELIHKPQNCLHVFTKQDWTKPCKNTNGKAAKGDSSCSGHPQWERGAAEMFNL